MSIEDTFGSMMFAGMSAFGMSEKLFVADVAGGMEKEVEGAITPPAERVGEEQEAEMSMANGTAVLPCPECAFVERGSTVRRVKDTDDRTFKVVRVLSRSETVLHVEIAWVKLRNLYKSGDRLSRGTR